jgi:two-component system, LytTR family, response regulator
MIRAFVVDDEPLAVKRLVRLLENTKRVKVVGSSSDPNEAVATLRETNCDVVFADIEMPGLTGFEMLRQLDPAPLVVFTTAYSEYALQAFELHSVDYLLKPVDERLLDRALGKLERIRTGVETAPPLDAILSKLAATLEKPRTHPARLPSRTGDKVEFVDLSEVTHFYASDKLTYAATAKKHFCIDRTIADLEESLDESKFVRIHRSTIVNIEFVQELHSWFAERLLLRLKDGKNTELAVARDRVKLLKERLGL